MTKNEFQLLYAIKKHGLLSYRKLSALSGTSLGYISDMVKVFTEKGYIDESGITQRGTEALAPYQVKNAVIMAAGRSSAFSDGSYDIPKGLQEINGQVLIERQIEQLQEAGIEEIIVVLGYKKEAFFHLEEQYGVKIIINPDYNKKNNIETLYLARKYIGNSYICSSDDYFAENVFTDYVYRSYYASVRVEHRAGEWYMVPDARGNVARVKKTGDKGLIMLGHSYWDREFSEAFVKLIELHREHGDYDRNLWEDLFADNIKKLPPMEIKIYPEHVIFEFDSPEELSAFHARFVKDTRSEMLGNICSVLGCTQQEITQFRTVKKGLTNRTYSLTVGGVQYIYRHPKDGSESIGSGIYEKRAQEQAKALGIDPTYLYMDAEGGWKLSRLVEGARIPDYTSETDSCRILSVLRRLHSCKADIGRTFDPWEEALKLEHLLLTKGGIAVRNFEQLKAKVEACYRLTRNDGVEQTFCHCDTYAANWLLTERETILIDWEYAATADPGCDVGSYIMDAGYDIETAEVLIKAYCGAAYDETLRRHYLAYTAVVSFYWFLWALYREACGAVMGASVHNWYVMAVRYANYFDKGM